jgi:hypothetical protein
MTPSGALSTIASPSMTFSVWGEELVRVIGIVVKNIGAQIDFGLRLAEQLAHLERHELGELVAVSARLTN